MGRKFEELDAKEVLGLAIRIEQRNGAELEAFARVFEGTYPEMHTLFKELAEEELDHTDRLQSMYDKRFGGEGPPPEVDPKDVDELVEYLDFDGGAPSVMDQIDVKTVLAAVDRAEQAAITFYEQAATATKDDELRSLFKTLAELEASHRARLELDESDES